MTATRVIVGIPKRTRLIFRETEFEDLCQTTGGDDDFIKDGNSLAEDSDFDFYVFTSHVARKDRLLKRLQKHYTKFFYVQLTE